MYCLWNVSRVGKAVDGRVCPATDSHMPRAAQPRASSPCSTPVAATVRMKYPLEASGIVTPHGHTDVCVGCMAHEPKTPWGSVTELLASAVRRAAGSSYLGLGVCAVRLPIKFQCRHGTPLPTSREGERSFTGDGLS